MRKLAIGVILSLATTFAIVPVAYAHRVHPAITEYTAASHTYNLAKDFSSGGTWAAHNPYWPTCIYNGQHSFPYAQWKCQTSRTEVNYLGGGQIQQCYGYALNVDQYNKPTWSWHGVRHIGACSGPKG